MKSAWFSSTWFIMISWSFWVRAIKRITKSLSFPTISTSAYVDSSIAVLAINLPASSVACLISLPSSFGTRISINLLLLFMFDRKCYCCFTVIIVSRLKLTLSYLLSGYRCSYSVVFMLL